MGETALDKLKELIELDKITKIIYFSRKSVELDKETTFLLMQETSTEDLLPALEFQGQDFKVVIDEEDKTFKYISLKEPLTEGAGLKVDFYEKDTEEIVKLKGNPRKRIYRIS